MNHPDHAGLVSIGASVLTHMRGSITQLAGDQAATLLQEAGYISGPEIHAAFQVWLNEETQLADPGDLDSSYLGPKISEFFERLGWGKLELTELGDTLLAFDATQWVEAGPDTSAQTPSCHFTTGLLAAFMSELAGGDMAVMQVECTTCGDQRCRFLAGSAPTLERVFEALSRGEPYSAALEPANSVA